MVLLERGGLGGLNLAGAACALGAGAMWAAYILLSARTGSRFPKVDGLALAMAVSAVITLPVGVVSAGAAIVDPLTLTLGAAVAVLSSVLPYSLELLSLRRLPAATFAVLMSLAPGIAAAAGYLILGQAQTRAEGLAIALVVAASVGAVHTSAAQPTSGTAVSRFAGPAGRASSPHAPAAATAPDRAAW